jgi:hypothetical protein
MGGGGSVLNLNFMITWRLMTFQKLLEFSKRRGTLILVFNEIFCHAIGSSRQSCVIHNTSFIVTDPGTERAIEQFPKIDMDMSYTRVLHIKVAHRASHK